MLAVDVEGTMLMVQRGVGRVAGRTGQVMLSGTPAGKIPKPEEMTGAALFLASEDAHHITGSYMISDGGHSMLGA